MRPLVRNTLIGLSSIYGVELLVRYGLGWGEALDALRMSAGSAFGWHQAITRYAVLGDVPFLFFISLIAVYFLLAQTYDQLGRAVFLRATAASMVGGTLLSLAAATLAPSLANGSTGGYGHTVLMLLPLFGLAYPHITVRLFFVLPVQASWVTWGFGVFATLSALSLNLSSVEQLGAWLGLVGWWFQFGPGARRRQLIAKSRTIERELQRFEVIEGGRSDDDDLVN